MPITYTPAQSYTVKLRERGQLTIPQPVREAFSLNKDDQFTFLIVGDSFLLTPKLSIIDELSRQFSQIMDEENVTLSDLLAGLEEQRKAIWQERWADAT